ncbi:hypothetical protein H6761_01510 [Candidatus Nomurabacteria bacterium]|nr:hypothetical protein [Candidatus Nomurabacteria bacterium]
MKYLGLLFVFLLTYTVYAFLDFTTWHWLNPFLLSLIFLYYANSNPWIYYSAALIFGLTLDAFSASFGLHTISFLLMIFVISNLQLTIFTSKNTGTIFFLTFLANFLFWLIFWIIYWISPWQLYIFDLQVLIKIIRFIFIDTFLVFIFYILYFNLWLKKHER